MKLDKDLISGIDLLVEKLSKDGVVSEYMNMSDLERKSIRFLKENEFIKPSGNKKFQYHSTSEINKIRELGIKEYLKTKEVNENSELEIQRLTIENLQLQNLQLKRTVLYSVIGFIMGGIVTNLKDILNLLKILSPE